MQEHRASLAPPTTGGWPSALSITTKLLKLVQRARAGLKSQPSSPALSVETRRNVPVSEACESNVLDFSFQRHQAPTANFLLSQACLGPASAVGQSATGWGLVGLGSTQTKLELMLSPWNFPSGSFCLPLFPSLPLLNNRSWTAPGPEIQIRKLQNKLTLGCCLWGSRCCHSGEFARAVLTNCDFCLKHLL